MFRSLATLPTMILPKPRFETGKEASLTGCRNFQTRRVLVVRFLREGEAVVGKLMLMNGEVKQNMGGKTETVMVCRTESERVRALEEYFNITLTEEERGGVRGRNVDLDI